MKLVYLTFLSGLLAFNLLNAQKTWLYQDCVAYALEHSQDISIAKLHIDSRDLQFKDRITEIIPGLNSSASYGINSGKAVDPNTNDIIQRQFFSNSYSISSALTLFNGFRQYNRILFEKYNYEIEKDRLNQISNDLMYTVIEAYTDCLLSSGLKDIQQEQLDFSSRELDRIKKMIEVGRIPGTDLYESQARLSRDEFLLLQYENQLKNNLGKLMQLMNLPKDSAIVVKNPVQDDPQYQVPDFDTVFESAMEIHPGISRLEKEVLAARTSLKIAKGAFWPSVSVSASWSTGYYETSRDSLGTTIPFRDQFSHNQHMGYGASLRIPIFSSFSRKHQVQQAVINEDIAKANLDKNTSILLYQIQDLIRKSESAISEYQSAQKQLFSDQAAFEAAIKKRDSGLISIMDYFESKNNLARARVEVLRTELQLFLNENILRFYLTGSYLPENG